MSRSPRIHTYDPSGEGRIVKVLVTGAGGFVGHHLVAHLKAEGDDVISTDRSLGGPDLNDGEALTALVLDVSPDAIYHLAGDADVGGSWNHPAVTFRNNANGTLALLEAARAAGTERVLSISSADVYGKVLPSELPLTELSPLRPTSPYAASKVAAEFLGVQAHLGHGLDVIGVRAFNHIGPGQSTNFVAPAVACRIAEAERDHLDDISVGNLTPRRDLTDVRDVVRAYRLLISHGEPGEIYNVCSGQDVSIGELCSTLIGMSIRPLAMVPDPDMQRAVDLPVLRGDHAKLTAATGWKPAIAVATSLADLLEDCRQRVGVPTVRT